MFPKLSFPLRRGVLHVHVSVSFAKYGTLTSLTIFGHKRRSPRGLLEGATEFFAMLSLSALCYDFFPSFMDLYGHCLRTVTSVDVRN